MHKRTLSWSLVDGSNVHTFYFENEAERVIEFVYLSDDTQSQIPPRTKVL